LQEGDRVGTVKILSGQAECVELIANADFSYALASDEEVEILLPEPGFAYAPVVQGQSAGEAHICLNGKSIGVIPLVYGKTVELETQKQISWWEKLFKGGRNG